MNDIEIKANNNVLNINYEGSLTAFLSNKLFSFRRLKQSENTVYKLWTGLRDKEGKKIYLGDPVRVDGIGNVRVVLEAGAFGYIYDGDFYSFLDRMRTGDFLCDENGVMYEVTLIEDNLIN